MSVTLPTEPPFRSMLRATGVGEIWTHTNDHLKFKEFGWRTTSTDTAYQNATLIGNWSEDRFDIEEQKRAKQLPSAYLHYFDTEYDERYNDQAYKVPDSLKNLRGRDPHAFPSHQPELDPSRLQAVYNSWATTQRTSYVHPKLRTEVIPDK